MTKHLLFIFNPFSGKKEITRNLFSIINYFTKKDCIVTVHPTQSVNDCYEYVCGCGDLYDIIVCAGGDGTLNETIKGIMTLHFPPTLAYIPCGSTNDFAYTLGIPKSIEKATKIALTDNIFGCDIGTFNGDYFTYVAAFGAFTEVSYQTPQNMKNMLGHLAYLLEAIKSLPKITSYDLKIEADGKFLHGRYVLGMVSNAHSIGGYKNLQKLNTELDDGLFEVVLIKEPRNAIDTQNIITAILTQNTASPYFHIFKAKKIKFTSKVEIPWTVDGESGGSHKYALIKNHRKALKICVPSKNIIATLIDKGKQHLT